MSDRKRLSEVVNVLVNLVRNIQLRRQLSVVCADPQLAFWRLIYGDLTDIAVLEWCKLFGSDDDTRQALHWKSLVSDHAKFRTDMLSRLGIYESKWRSYWNEMKLYRDKSVAHHDLRRSEITNYPKFDLALKSAYFYYEFIVAELRKLGIEQQPNDLRECSLAFSDQCREVASAAVRAAKSCRGIWIIRTRISTRTVRQS
jgi:hypothetical protein